MATSVASLALQVALRLNDAGQAELSQAQYDLCINMALDDLSLAGWLQRATEDTTSLSFVAGQFDYPVPTAIVTYAYIQQIFVQDPDGTFPVAYEVPWNQWYIGLVAGVPTFHFYPDAFDLLIPGRTLKIKGQKRFTGNLAASDILVAGSEGFLRERAVAYAADILSAGSDEQSTRRARIGEQCWAKSQQMLGNHPMEFRMLPNSRLVMSDGVGTSPIPVPTDCLVMDGITYALTGLGLQAAHNALPSSGGCILIPSNTTVDISDQTVTFSKSVTLHGENPGTSKVVSAHGTNNGIVSTHDFCQFESINFNRTGGNVATGGSALVIDGLGDTTNLVANASQHVQIHKCYFFDWFHDVTFLNTSSYNMTNCDFAGSLDNSVTNSPRSPFFDTGDSMITDCTWQGSVGAGIFWTAGGGLKITSCKINGCTYGIWLQPGAGVTTSQIQVVNCSIENQTISSIFGDGSAGGTLIDCTFNGIVCGSNVGNGLKGVRFTGASFAQMRFSNLYINMNGVTNGVGLSFGAGVRNMDVTGNTLLACTTGLEVEDGAGVIYDGTNTFPLCTTAIADNRATANGLNSKAAYEATLPISGVTSAVTYTNLLKITCNNYAQIEIDLSFSLLLSGFGGIGRVTRQIFSGPASNVMTSVFDTTAIAALDLQWDVATTPGSVIIGIRRNAAAGGTSLDGNVHVKVRGICKALLALV